MHCEPAAIQIIRVTFTQLMHKIKPLLIPRSPLGESAYREITSPMKLPMAMLCLCHWTT